MVLPACKPLPVTIEPCEYRPAQGGFPGISADWSAAGEALADWLFSSVPGGAVDALEARLRYLHTNPDSANQA